MPVANHTSLRRRTARHQSSLEISRDLLIVSTEDLNASNGIIFALNRFADNLEAKWQYDIPNKGVVRFPVLFPQEGFDILLLGAINFSSGFQQQYDNHLIALNSSNGKVLWKFSPNSGLGDISTPLILDNGIFFIGQTQEGTKAYLIDAVKPNRIIWSNPFPFRFPTNLPVSYESMIYLAAGKNGVVAYQKSDGELTGRFNLLDGKEAVILHPAVTQEFVIAVTSIGKVVAFDRETQKQVWERTVGRSITTGPFVVGDRIFIGSKKGSPQRPEAIYQISALNLKDGDFAWNSPFEQLERHHFHAPLVAHNGFLLCGSDSGRLFSVDMENGKGKEIYKFDKQIYCRPVISPEGHIFASDLTTNIVALQQIETGSSIGSLSSLDFMKSNSQAKENTDSKKGREKSGLQTEARYLKQMRLLIVKHFNLSELKTLCFDLGLDYENIEGSTKEEKITELLGFTKRHVLVRKLAKELEEKRPNLDWPTIPPTLEVS